MIACLLPRPAGGNKLPHTWSIQEYLHQCDCKYHTTPDSGCYNANLLITSPASSVTIWRQNMSVIILALFLQLWDVPIIMHVWQKGKCRHKHSLPRPHSSSPAAVSSLLNPRLMPLQSGLSLSHSSLYHTLSLPMKAECIYSPACHPAASKRGITSATMSEWGLQQALWLTAARAGFTTLCGGIELRVCFCLSGRFHCIIMGSLSNLEESLNRLLHARRD